MLKVLNNDNSNEVNILHFQGECQKELPKTQQYILENAEIHPFKDDISVISCWTEDYKCMVKTQFDKAGIPLINAVPENYDKTQEWDMRKKIDFIISTLENVTSKLSLILDGYDVLIANTDTIVEKFKNQEYRILYNASVNNYPEVQIDNLYNRATMGWRCYFNAGCCIGYTKDLLKFYKESKKYLDIENPWESEQLVIRCAFAKYSSDKNQRFIGIDYKNIIFQTMALSACNVDTKLHIISLGDNTQELINKWRSYQKKLYEFNYNENIYKKYLKEKGEA